MYLKLDVILWTTLSEVFIKASNKGYDVNPLNCVSSSGYTWGAVMKYNNIKLQTLQDKDMIPLSEK